MKTVLMALLVLILCFAWKTDTVLLYWEQVLLGYAGLVLAPWGLILLATPRRLVSTAWLSALALCGAFALPEPAPIIAIAAIPYLLGAVWILLSCLTKMLLERQYKFTDFLRLFALGYWTVGALWTCLYLADQPVLGFSRVLSGLTAAHFHVAGFALTVLLCQMNLHFPGKFTRILGFAGLLGMPAVAGGIVATQLGYSPVIEQVAAGCFAGMALIVAIWQLWAAATKPLAHPVKLLWAGGAICLLIGATLAGLYALRFVYPIEWLSIQYMKIWHGTLNTIGFATLTLAGWRKYQSSLPQPGWSLF